MKRKDCGKRRTEGSWETKENRERKKGGKSGKEEGYNGRKQDEKVEEEEEKRKIICKWYLSSVLVLILYSLSIVMVIEIVHVPGKLIC
jgi:hypothetical protein